MQKEEYQKSIENQNLLASTAKVYWRAIKELTDAYGDNPSIDQINSFIVKKNTRRQPHVKYAIYHFLKILGREEDYKKLTKAKLRNPIRQKNFLTKEKIMEIIDNIKNDKHRLIAKIQINTGTRASEIISLNKRRISLETLNNKKIARITIKGKGEKARSIYLKESLLDELTPFCDKVRLYPFLEKEGVSFLKGEPITYLSFWTRVETEYKKYWDSLKKASSLCRANISTHDLRRSFAELIRIETGDIYRVQRALGHSNINTTARYFENKEEEVADTMIGFQERA